METEDVTAVSKDVELLKNQFDELAKQVKDLQEQRVSWIWQIIFGWYTTIIIMYNIAIQNVMIVIKKVVALATARFGWLGWKSNA